MADEQKFLCQERRSTNRSGLGWVKKRLVTDEDDARTWQEWDPTSRRVTDFATGEVVVPAECDAFNIRKEGICGTPLTALDDCARAYDHREV